MNEIDKHIELISSIAFDKQKYLQKRIELGEGLVGRVVLEKKSIYLKLVPKDYINITSGLGKANPRNIILEPLICLFSDVLCQLYLSSLLNIEINPSIVLIPLIQFIFRGL